MVTLEACVHNIVGVRLEELWAGQDSRMDEFWRVQMGLRGASARQAEELSALQASLEKLLPCLTQRVEVQQRVKQCEEHLENLEDAIRDSDYKHGSTLAQVREQIA